MTIDISKAIKDGGSFDIIRRRLLNAADELQKKTDTVNEVRNSTFGGGELSLSGNINLLTSSNCTPVDMARVGENLLFGFSTKLGIKSHLEVEDLFSVYCLKSEQTQPEMIPLKETFIYNKEFLNDLNNLLTYNKAAKLKQLYRKSDELFIVFSISDVSADFQHFRFSLANPDSPKYLGYSSGRPSVERHSMNWSRLLDGDIIGSTTPLYSVANEIFIGMATNELTFKVDDNSSNGLSILNENVENKFQRTQDLVVHQCKEGNLIFLKVKLLDEKSERFYVFNTITQNIVRADGIKNGVQSLPEDHGVIFSNGYALSSGEVKTFSGEPVSLEFHKAMYSPNGEDCLFFYADIVSSEYTIYHYNMINKAVAPPMHACGYALKQSGELYMFRSSQNSQPEKLHKLQVWQTPFMGQEAYSLIDKSSENSSVIKNIGNAALVRGISDIKSILKLIRDEDVSSSLYEGIIKSVTKAIDTHHWFSDAELHSLNTDLASIKTTSELVLEEFNKTSELARSAKSKAKSLADECQDLIHNVNVLRGDDTTRYLTLLQESKLLLGKLIEAKSIRFIDAEEIDELQSNISSQKAKVVDSLVSLLQRKSAFKGFHDAIASIQDAIQSASKSSEVNPQLTKIAELTDALTSLNDEVSEIEVEDSTKITFIIEQLSQCFTSINTLRSSANSKLKDFARIEAEKEFAVQIKQLDQMIEVAMNRANTPTECDNELAKLTAQFEKLEGRFADFDDYIGKVITKRNDTYSNIETRKTQLVSEIQRRISNIKKSASISLKNIQQRASRLATIAELHALFTSDSMVSKIREYSEQIEALGDAVVASSLIGELNAIREQSARDIRDKQDLFEDNGRLVVLGKHRFSVNKKEVSLNIISRDGKPHAAISSTDFSQPIENSELNELVEYFDFDVPSENAKTYRGEYLAFQLLNEVSGGIGIVNHDSIKEHLKKKSLGLSSELENVISEHISKSYKEGYIRGVHDIDGLKILEAVYPLYFSDNGSSKVSQQSRIDAMNLFNVLKSNGELSEIHKNLTSMKEAANTLSAPSVFTEALRQYSIKYQTSNDVIECLMDSTYFDNNALTCHFKISHEAHDLLNEVKERGINLEVFTCNDETKAVFKQVALQVNNKLSDGYIEEAYAAITADISSSIGSTSIYEVQGLVGDHPVINKGVIKSDVESFVARCQYIQNTHSTQFDQFVETRQSLANEWEKKLQLSEFEAKPLSNFVRNKLIKDCYLPMIGDSLAQQMGSAGSTTSAQNGGLLLLSPPGYGKTTLLEYVAKIMGVVFVKINCPTIGHEVTGIVPEEAESAAARKELVKLNMALEMGNNVLLYLDDIQHLHTEFLQKFISLCDGTRKIEGSWEGVAKTYDMKGKRFAIAMAGNPYTENGEAFKVPDMLVNRMSSYNLGDIMTGMEEAFELSYIENALTSNKVTAALASRSQDDLYKLIRMAKGEEIGIAELEHNYSPAEASEIIEILKQMLAIQDVILKVNAEYIRSAAMNHRKEPQFLLQGSYRNMSKMVEKLVPAMNENDIEALIFDHYRAESQTLTTGAEENMLRFKQLIGKMTDEDKVRWSEITKSYVESAVNLSDTPVEERTLKAILSIAEAIKSDK